MKKTILLACLACLSTYIYAQPGNDLCANATPLTLGTNTCMNITVTNVDATDSGETPAPGCASYSGGDVWFSLMVPASGDVDINLSTGGDGGVTDTGMAAYSGTCGGLTLIDCDDDDGAGVHASISLTGRTPGEVILIRAWEFGNNSFGEFNICAINLDGSPPANDDCANATPLAVTPPNGTCTPVSATVINATDSGESTTCTGTEDDDIWFSFVANEDTEIIDISNLSGSTTDIAMGVFSGDCGALVNLDCTDTNSGLTVTGLTPGDTYYIQVYTWTSTPGQTTSFDICVNDLLPPASDMCDDPTPFCGNGNPYQANTTGTAPIGNMYGCLLTQPRPAWFYLEVDMAGDIDLSLNNTVDLDFALWGPFPGLAAAQAACGFLPAPIDCSFTGGTVVETPSITGAQAGEVYILLVTAYSATPTTFNIEQTNEGDAGAGTTDCTIVPVELIHFSGVANEAVNTLHWTSASEQNTQWHIVERSIDGKENWEILGQVDAAGNSVQTIDYTFEDAKPLTAAYYRIRTLDFDGSEAYSERIYIERNSKFAITNVQPVPTTNTLFVDYTMMDNAEVTFSVTNLLGTVLQQHNTTAVAGDNRQAIDLLQFDKGIYLLTLTHGTTQVVRRIVKQ